jgi:phosphoglycerol transferase MdoB-like AlkP superfamily enzyme
MTLAVAVGFWPLAIAAGCAIFGVALIYWSVEERTRAGLDMNSIATGLVFIMASVAIFLLAK